MNDGAGSPKNARRRAAPAGRAPDAPAAARPKGLKAALPSKPCVACGRPMGWRRRWAKTWDEVKYCSDACRRKR